MTPDSFFHWMSDNIIPSVALGILFWLAKTASQVSKRTLNLETDLKLAINTFTEQAKRTNEHIESMLKKMEKLDEHQDRIVRIEEREKTHQENIKYLKIWREEHEKVHATNR